MPPAPVSKPPAAGRARAPRARGTAAGLAALLLAAAPAGAEETAADTPKGTLNLVLENDLFNGVDREYTSGVQLNWVSGPDAAPGWARRGAGLLPFFPDNARVRAVYGLGQTMYTPSDISLADPPADDRPYAGFLFASIGLIAETGRRLDQLQLQLGMVGPSSLAEPSQKIIHEIINSPDPKGWDTQLEDEPGVVLTYQRSWRAFASGELLGTAFDVTPHAGGALGNVFTYANTGAMLRVGWHLPDDYGPPRIQPSLPGSGFFVPREPFGLYFFAGVEGRAVARNIFLDGNSWKDSRSVDREVLVGDLQLGLAFTMGDLRIAYTQVFRTREFETQDDRHDFGAVSISYRF